MFDTEFQQAYLKKGSKCYIFFTRKVHSSTQIKKDAIALYGALLSACPEGSGRMILNANRRKQDGIKAWIEMLDRYEADGNINLRIKKLEIIISTPYHKRYKGGLSRWVQDYENAFSELHKLGVTVWQGDEEKKRCIIQNATHIGISNTLMSEIVASNRSFVEVCKFLHSHATQQEYTSAENRLRNIMRTQQTRTESSTVMDEDTQQGSKDAWIC